ncbi:tyrosine-type recombinase/integrase [Peribacillus muralis]|uniref:tyrosine-type recombinase/integrase n=1 Tax=Peribacillus muralis TaxID=264697 RepID=UPI001F4E7F8F|nr:tyrosine-type recombinase/integrase [Peribacillus muralis]MCK1995345.1 tyrosine-type recombinase/integrase [Peribacillus muralis]MCK2015876.1 tyrosine-type recombinase/integrase [Peribacillus muralis]
MYELVAKTKDLQIRAWKKNLSDISIHTLQERLDTSEKNGQDPFINFSDVDMLQWFLQRREHLNQKHEKSTRTIQAYEQELLQFIVQLLTYSTEIDIDLEKVVDGSLFKSLSPRHIRRYQVWLSEKSPYVVTKGAYSVATLSRKTTIIKRFLKFLFETGYITDPIHEGFYKISIRKDERPNRDLGPKEVIQILDYFKEINHPIVFSIIHILTMTGMRNEEFTRLRVKDLQYDSITSTYFLEVLGKGNKRRQIPLKEKGMISIRMFRSARGLDDIDVAVGEAPLFTTNTGRAYSPSYLSQCITKAIKESGLPFLKFRSSSIGPHTFRHAFAIISHLNGVDVYQIMKSLGHEQLSTTEIYLEKVFEKERHAIHLWKSDVFGEYI